MTDNSSLFQAQHDFDVVIPVYIVSQWKRHHQWTGPMRQEFLCGSLSTLRENLKKLGGGLVVRSGDPLTTLRTLVRESGAKAIYFNCLYDPFDVQLEQELEKEGASWGVEVRGFLDNVMLPPESLKTQDGRPFRVFTPFARAWGKQKKPAPSPTIKRLRSDPKVKSEPLPELTHWGLKAEGKIIEPGENAARSRLNHFLSGPISDYLSKRNVPGETGTSRLSQDLRFGLLSVREVHERCQARSAELPAGQRKSVAAYINELVWREFYAQLTWHYPKILDEDFNDQFSTMKWDQDAKTFQRWSNGETGFPIVDAGMRQLNATGFMHNRVRMITAMFLTKDLHHYWREGEQYFMKKLVDGDIPANNGGWQWSAGTGADAAPYFRIQNPWTQTKTYDPDGIYIKQWIPELKEVDPKEFQKPPGRRLSQAYPEPMVDHSKARDLTLERFNQARANRPAK